MSFFIPTAFAAPAANAIGQTSVWSNILFMLLIFIAVTYFLIWRPQSRRMKAQQSLISSLKKGDEVITSSGILGKITKMSNDFVVIEIHQNVEIPMQKSSIASILPKGTIKKIL